MKVDPAIYQISVGREPFAGFPPPNAFLVCGSDSSVMIDAGWAGDEDHAQRIELLNSYKRPPISRVLLTHRHPDHAGGALALHQELHATLACHDLEKPAIKSQQVKNTEIQIESLSEGLKFDLGKLTIEIINTPGHTLGCVAPYVPELDAVFASDTVMGISTTVVRPTEGDLGKYEDSLRKMKDLKPKIIYPGHGPPVRDPMQRLDFLLDHRFKRENQLIEILAKSEMRIEDLCEVMYKGISKPRKMLANDQINSMLIKLEKEGTVKVNQDAIWKIS